MKYKDILGYSKPKKKVIKEEVHKPTLTEELMSEFGPLTEAKELDSEHIEKISKMTDRNDHLGARTYLSYLLGGTKGKLRQYYDAASQINVVFGHTPPELSKLNQKMEKQLYKDIKRKFKNSKEIIGAL